jgi:hypothetical protein
LGQLAQQGTLPVCDSLTGGSEEVRSHTNPAKPSFTEQLQQQAAVCACRLPAAVRGPQAAAPAAVATAGAHSSCRQRTASLVAAAQPGGIDLAALGLEIPDIDASDIATYQQELGAEFDVSVVSGVTTTSWGCGDSMRQFTLQNVGSWGGLPRTGVVKKQL